MLNHSPLADCINSLMEKIPMKNLGKYHGLLVDIYVKVKCTKQCSYVEYAKVTRYSLLLDGYIPYI